jgi:hypothetical protein
MKSIACIFFLVTAMLSSCSGPFGIEKRHYRSGFYITAPGPLKAISPQKSAKKSAGAAPEKSAVINAIPAEEILPLRLIAGAEKAKSKIGNAGKISGAAAKPEAENVSADLPVVHDSNDDSAATEHKKAAARAANYCTVSLALLVAGIVFFPLAIMLVPAALVFAARASRESEWAVNGLKSSNDPAALKQAERAERHSRALLWITGIITLLIALFVLFVLVLMIGLV